MARDLIASTTHREAASGSRARMRSVRVRLAVALPLLAILLAFTLPGVVFAGGSGAGVSISPASGPVGAHVTVTGTNFTPGAHVSVGYSTGNCSSGVVNINGATGVVGSDGGVSVSFPWPSTPVGSYYVCVTDQSNGQHYRSGAPFQVLSASAPKLTVTSPVTAGKPIQVTGANFLPGGGTVGVYYGPAGSNGCATPAGTTDVKSDGSFSLSFNAPYSTTDTTIVVTGVEPQDSCGQSAVLSAQANVSVTGVPQATPTTAATVAPTAAPTTPPTQGITFPPLWPPSGAWLVAYCLIGLLLLLLLLLLLFLLVRRRRKNEPVTIEERDTVSVNAAGASATGAGAAGMGRMTLERDIIARDAKGRETPIAQEVYSSDEEIVDDPGR